MSKLSIPSLLVLSLLCGGCEFLTGRSWVQTYSGSPLSFTVPLDSSDAVWSRASSWFGTYTTPRLASQSDTLLQSAETKTGKGWYMVAIARMDTAGEHRITVSYITSDTEDSDIMERARDRASELAYIARTGDNQQAFIQRGAR